MKDNALADHALARLIAEHRQQTGETYEVIAARGGIAKSVVNYWATNELTRMPTKKNLEGLAKGLKLTGEKGFGVVLNAAQEACYGYKSWQVELPDDARTKAVIADFRDLTEAQQAIIAAAAAEFKASNQQK